MILLDAILNLAVLLLWLNWRSVRLDPLANSTPRTLAGTLKPIKPRQLKGWPSLAAVGLLLVLRAVVCLAIGAPVDWTPKLNLGFVALAFRSDAFATAALYSLLSFVRLVLVFYFWLLVLVAASRESADPDPIHKLLRLHLGRVARWPGAVQVLLPLVLAAVLWMLCEPLLARCAVVNRADSFSHLVAQGLLVGIGLLLSLKYLIPALLLAYLVISYVYLGNSPVWDFISASSHNLLAPLRRVPLQLAKVDLAPVAGVFLVLVVLHWFPNYLVGELARRNLTIWPR